ncbi:MAG TPA: hypothetical protein VK773_09900 [Acidimicrobiales bacterium]|jgi:hypothetical protein|nr:hypothetical protein [Acidimicrobiales bacterium]
MRVRAASAPLQIVAAGIVAALALAGVSPLVAGGASPSASKWRPPALSSVVLAALGFGYTVTSQGPLDASQFATGSPSASAAAGALSTLGNTIETYQRSWRDTAGVNQVQDLVVRFPTDGGARAFAAAASRALANGQVVSSGPLPSVPGARRVTYFSSSDQAGVGQTITMRVGDYAAVISSFSAASGNPAPITSASAEQVAKAQYTALASAAAAGTADTPAAGRGVSAADVGWAVLAAVVLVAVVATLLVSRRRRERAH